MKINKIKILIPIYTLIIVFSFFGFSKNVSAQALCSSTQLCCDSSAGVAGPTACTSVKNCKPSAAPSCGPNFTTPANGCGSCLCNAPGFVQCGGNCQLISTNNGKTCDIGTNIGAGTTNSCGVCVANPVPEPGNWHTLGNSDIIDSIKNFFGTISKIDLSFRTNNKERARITSDTVPGVTEEGNVGIGGAIITVTPYDITKAGDIVSAATSAFSSADIGRFIVSSSGKTYKILEYKNDKSVKVNDSIDTITVAEKAVTHTMIPASKLSVLGDVRVVRPEGVASTGPGNKLIIESPSTDISPVRSAEVACGGNNAPISDPNQKACDTESSTTPPLPKLDTLNSYSCSVGDIGKSYTVDIKTECTTTSKTDVSFSDCNDLLAKLNGPNVFTDFPYLNTITKNKIIAALSDTSVISTKITTGEPADYVIQKYQSGLWCQAGTTNYALRTNAGDLEFLYNDTDKTGILTKEGNFAIGKGAPTSYRTPLTTNSVGSGAILSDYLNVGTELNIGSPSNGGVMSWFSSSSTPNLSLSSSDASKLGPTGNLYFDKTKGKFQISENGGKYHDIGGANYWSENASTTPTTLYNTDLDRNIGIGTDNATAKLEVKGESKFDDNVYLKYLNQNTPESPKLVFGSKSLSNSYTPFVNVNNSKTITYTSGLTQTFSGFDFLKDNNDNSTVGAVVADTCKHADGSSNADNVNKFDCGPSDTISCIDTVTEPILGTSNRYSYSYHRDVSCYTDSNAYTVKTSTVGDLWFRSEKSQSTDPQLVFTTNGQLSFATSTPSESAILDMSNVSHKGVLTPQVNLTGTDDKTTILDNQGVALGNAVTTGTIVYNATSTGDVKPGYYYWDGSKWATLGGGGGDSLWEKDVTASSVTSLKNLANNVGINNTTPKEQFQLGSSFVVSSSEARAVATVDEKDGHIKGVVVQNTGSGFDPANPPTVSIDAPPCVGINCIQATATVNIDNVLVSTTYGKIKKTGGIVVGIAGKGYDPENPPKITFSSTGDAPKLVANNVFSDQGVDKRIVDGPVTAMSFGQVLQSGAATTTPQLKIRTADYAASNTPIKWNDALIVNGSATSTSVTVNDLIVNGSINGNGSPWTRDMVNKIVKLTTTTDNVGVGTETPGAKLEVNGTGLFDDNLKITNPIGKNKETPFLIFSQDNSNNDTYPSFADIGYDATATADTCDGSDSNNDFTSCAPSFTGSCTDSSRYDQDPNVYKNYLIGGGCPVGTQDFRGRCAVTPIVADIPSWKHRTVKCVQDTNNYSVNENGLGDLQFKSDSYAYAGSASSTGSQVVFTKDGLVGIGITKPRGKFEIVTEKTTSTYSYTYVENSALYSVFNSPFNSSNVPVPPAGINSCKCSSGSVDDLSTFDCVPGVNLFAKTSNYPSCYDRKDTYTGFGTILSKVEFKVYENKENITSSTAKGTSFVVQKDGKVGIGTGSYPVDNSLLQVNGTTHTNKMTIGNGLPLAVNNSINSNLALSNKGKILTSLGNIGVSKNTILNYGSYLKSAAEKVLGIKKAEASPLTELLVKTAVTAVFVSQEIQKQLGLSLANAVLEVYGNSILHGNFTVFGNSITDQNSYVNGDSVIQGGEAVGTTLSVASTISSGSLVNSDYSHVCADSNGKLFICGLPGACGKVETGSPWTSVPFGDLCSAGTAQNVPVLNNSTDMYDWTCTTGQAGGTDATCHVAKQPTGTAPFSYSSGKTWTPLFNGDVTVEVWGSGGGGGGGGGADKNIFTGTNAAGGSGGGGGGYSKKIVNVISGKQYDVSVGAPALGGFGGVNTSGNQNGKPGNDGNDSSFSGYGIYVYAAGGLGGNGGEGDLLGGGDSESVTYSRGGGSGDRQGGSGCSSEVYLSNGSYYGGYRGGQGGTGGDLSGKICMINGISGFGSGGGGSGYGDGGKGGDGGTATGNIFGLTGSSGLGGEVIVSW